MPHYFSISSTPVIPTYNSQWKRNQIMNCPFWIYTLIDNMGPMVVTRVFRKKTFTGLLTCFSSFTSFSYKIGLVKTLVDRALKICNTWQAFNDDVASLTFILKKNLYPFKLIERIINCSVSEQEPNTFYFKLPYIGYFSSIPQKCVHRLSHSYCNNANIVLAFSSFKVGSLFSVKDPIPNGLWSCVVYKFSCAGCAACYVRPPDISTQVQGNTWKRTGPHTFWRTWRAHQHVALHVPMTILPSSIRHPCSLLLKSKRCCSYFGTNQHFTHRLNMLI